MSIIKSGTTTTTAYSVDANTNGDLVFIVSESLTAMSITAAGAVSLPTSSLTITSGATLNGGVVVNDPGADVDFRVEGDTDSNLLFVDASTDRVGVGTDTPGSKLSVTNSVATAYNASNTLASGQTARISNTNTGSSVAATLIFEATGGGGGNGLGTISGVNTGTGSLALTFGTRDSGGSVTEHMRLNSAGNLGLGVTPSAWESGRAVFQFGPQSALNGTGNNTQFSNNYYADSTGTAKYIGTGYAQRYQQNSLGQHVWQIAPSGTAGNTITFTQAMTLDASGRLGIGETSPSTTLDVKAAQGRIKLTSSTGTNNTLLLFNNTGGNAYVGLDNSAGGLTSAYALNIFHEGNYPITFSTNNTERARITANGYLLVETTSTSATSGVGSKFVPEGRLYQVSSYDANTQESLSMYSTGASAYRFYVGWGGTVYATNTSISAISDQRLKENIRDLDAGLDAVMALKPRKFDWKEGKGANTKDARGFIAQEFEQVFPDLVDEWRDPAPEGEEPYKSVRQDLIPVLVKAIQELKAELDATKAEVAALKGAN